LEVGAGVALGGAVGAGVGVEPPPPPWLPPLVGLGVGVGVPVGDGLGVGVVHGFHQRQQVPFGLVPWWHSLGEAVADDVAVAVGVGVGLAAADAPETPASMSANTPGSRVTAARALRRPRRAGAPIAFAFIDVLQRTS
jgi:hypothetical protein